MKTWAARAPTAVPGSIMLLIYFSLQVVKKTTTWDTVNLSSSIAILPHELYFVCKISTLLAISRKKFL